MWCSAYSTLEEQHSANIGSLHSGLPIYQWVKPHLFKNLKTDFVLHNCLSIKTVSLQCIFCCLRFRRIKKPLLVGLAGYFTKDCRQFVILKSFFVRKKQFKSMLVHMASTIVTKSIF